MLLLVQSISFEPIQLLDFLFANQHPDCDCAVESVLRYLRLLKTRVPYYASFFPLESVNPSWTDLVFLAYPWYTFRCFHMPITIGQHSYFQSIPSSCSRKFWSTSKKAQISAQHPAFDSSSLSPRLSKKQPLASKTQASQVWYCEVLGGLSICRSISYW